MTKSLTEQWKDGTLPEGWYYCQCYDEVKKLYCGDGESLELDDPETSSYYFFHRENGKGQVEVLGPVPSYEKCCLLTKKAERADYLDEKLKYYTPEECLIIKRLEKQLEIATKALKEYANCKPTEWMSCVTADKAIKEMAGVK